MIQQPSDAVSVREMSLYQQYYDLVAAGRKRVEVRVAYPALLDLAPGQRIRFRCGQQSTLTQVTRVTRYANFEELLDNEGVEAVNPTASRDDQLRAIRDIYPPAKEELGCLAIAIEKI
ncbi:ASCH domain-containing protein [Kitasatospora sp. NPDC088160]|uniref:ASCH domain-containing protein n=1 Tax=Kitasatospora sp. NPDC088160 TaxID=3364072 RepID=UPI00380EE684